MLIIRSRIIDMSDRKLRKTWKKLARSVQAEYVSNPANPDNVLSSWRLGETNADYRR